MKKHIGSMVLMCVGCFGIGVGVGILLEGVVDNGRSKI